MVNDQVVNVSSCQLKPGDKISVREKSKSMEAITESVADHPNNSSWLEWDVTTLAGVYTHAPERSDIPENIKEQLIVELYSK
jgi:small subunit ribosomal protein S4